MDESLYVGREQSLVKHAILNEYLLRFAMITGSKWNSITYVDCFSGPWKSQSEDYEDTSFAIAIRQLRIAKEEHNKNGRNIRLRAMFIEKDPDSFDELQSYVETIEDFEIEIVNTTLEDSIGRILEFIRAHTKTFPFIFIDPTGWSGFALDVIGPLLQLQRCEVLINFMTQHIIRFLENKQSQASFERLFGDPSFKEVIANLKGQKRVDEAVRKYCQSVGDVGDFKYSAVAGILHPEKNRHHFHLIYLTRHPKGLQVFKDAEKHSMTIMETARAKAEQRNRESKNKQMELFSADTAPESRYYRELRNRYLSQAQEAVCELIDRGVESYDDIWLVWLRFPLVWESDLKNWLRASKDFEIKGLKERETTPKLRKGHRVVAKTSGS